MGWGRNFYIFGKKKNKKKKKRGLISKKFRSGAPKIEYDPKKATGRR